jgi:hypothetical protein
VPNLHGVSRRLRRGPFPGAVIIVALAIGWNPPTGRSEERQRELPRDGAWVQYQWDWHRLDNGQKMSATVTLSIVGVVVEKDEQCRWVELKYVIPEGDEKRTLIEKLLIREKHLLESANPMEHVLRTWVRFNDEPARLKEPHQINDTLIGQMLLWTPGVLKDASLSGVPKDIEYQRGRLRSANSWTGKMVLPETNKDGQVVLRRSRKFALRRHAELPIGFAEAEIKDDVYDVDMTTVRSQQVSVYLLQDAGTDAKSSLPDNN